jgi:hypothetical protein
MVDFDRVDDIELEEAETEVVITTDARRVETVDSDWHRGTTTFTSEGTLELSFQPGLSLVNLDAYFDPGYFYDHPSELGQQLGQSKVVIRPNLASWSVRFEPFAIEVYAAARARAGEDSRETVTQLAEWLRNSKRDHIDDTVPRLFWQLLRDEVERTDETADWAVTVSGDLGSYYADEDPITDLDEAYEFARGGWDRVRSKREERS